MKPVHSLLLSLALAALPATAGAVDAARAAELRYLLAQDCGSCHGLTLRGGLGPSLRAADLAGKSPELLLATILDGRPGTAMPPWRPFLSTAEARWLLDQLLAGRAVR